VGGLGGYDFPLALLSLWKITVNKNKLTTQVLTCHAAVASAEALALATAAVSSACFLTPKGQSFRRAI